MNKNTSLKLEIWMRYLRTSSSRRYPISKEPLESGMVEVERRIQSTLLVLIYSPIRFHDARKRDTRRVIEISG